MQAERVADRDGEANRGSLLDEIDRAAVGLRRVLGDEEDALEERRSLDLAREEPRDLDQSRQTIGCERFRHAQSIRQAPPRAPSATRLPSLVPSPAEDRPCF
jgi:hypothetical protein